jgi:hypothetical protein
MTVKFKVILSVNEEGQDISGVSSEKVWCDQIEKDIYKITNIPFYAFGYSLGDEIYAPDLDTVTTHGDIVTHSENSTILILIMDDSRKDIYIKFSEKWQCEYGSAIARKSFAVSVPLQIPLKELALELNKLTEKNGDGFVVTTQRHYSSNDVFYS